MTIDETPKVQRPMRHYLRSKYNNLWAKAASKQTGSTLMAKQASRNLGSRRTECDGYHCQN